MSRSALLERIEAALANEGLRLAVKRATDNFSGGKARAVKEYDDWEAMREHAGPCEPIRSSTSTITSHSLAAKVRENGGYVHFASSADQAVEIVRNIARRYNVRSVAKSKSMISEEIHLNDALEKDGVEVFETDLGEYIIQLAGETPSHIVGPALHQDPKKDVAGSSPSLKEGKKELRTDTPTLTAVARPAIA